MSTFDKFFMSIMAVLILAVGSFLIFDQKSEQQIKQQYIPIQISKELTDEEMREVLKDSQNNSYGASRGGLTCEHYPRCK